MISPIEIEVKSARSGSLNNVSKLQYFNSYFFERSLLTPASAFRFTASGVEKDIRMNIRSSDIVSIFASTEMGRQPIATGILDETDTHILPSMKEFLITGRDTLGQLIDNDSIDAQNAKINMSEFSLELILKTLLKNTRIPPQFEKSNDLPTVPLLFQTNATETKLSALQRYLEMLNCLVWSLPDGRLRIGRPNFKQNRSGSLICMNDGSRNNFMDVRVRRNTNQAIRQVVFQLQSMEQVDAGIYTKKNNDKDVLDVIGSNAGRSIYRQFSYGSGSQAANTITTLGNQSGNPQTIGDNLSLREIARENMKVLEVEGVVMGHLNEEGLAFNIDQIYNVKVEDEDVEEDMYVHHVSYELTPEHGMITKLKLCRLGTICANVGMT